MKTKLNSVCCILLAGLTSGAGAQTLTPLVNFSGGNGANPQAGLVAAGTTLFGTTYAGGSSNSGTVFSVNTSGNNFSNLYTFAGAVYNSGTQTYNPADGSNPMGTLVLFSNMLFGTTSTGGNTDNGTVYAVNTNGGPDVVLYNFQGGGDGANPEAGLVVASNTLFGTTFVGGTAGEGSIFRINTDGTDFTNLYSFTGGTNGSNPIAGLVAAGGWLYGTTYGPYFDQSSGYGTVFKFNPTTGAFSNLYSFTNGTDGANPEATLLLSGGTLYGTAYAGGPFYGTVFKVGTNGSSFASYPFAFSVGANPQAALILSGNMLYGTTANGAEPGWGTVYELTTNGGSFSSLYAFTDSTDGASPQAPVVLLGSTLYGTTAGDLNSDKGTVFSLNLAPGAIPLSISRSGTQVVLAWTNSSFALQTSTNVRGTFTNIPSAASPYYWTIGGKQQFFRLQYQ